MLTPHSLPADIEAPMTEHGLRAGLTQSAADSLAQRPLKQQISQAIRSKHRERSQRATQALKTVSGSTAKAP